MTREETENQYDVVDGVIKSFGKFQGQKVYMPHVYEAYLDNFCDEDEENIIVKVTDEDHKEFPELGVGRTRVVFYIDSAGFVTEIL